MRRELTLATTALVLLTAILGSVVVIEVLHVILTQSSIARAEQQVAAIAAETMANGPGQGELEVPPGNTLTRIQIVNAAGRLVASSLSSDKGPLTALRPPAGEAVVQGSTPFPSLGDGVDPIVVARTISYQGSVYTILLEQSQIDQHEAVVTMGKILLVTLPLVLLVATVASAAVVGRALAPVDAIRLSVDRITLGNLGDRVPVPAGHDEVGRLAMTMNIMLARLDTAQDKQQQFVSDASHELRSPLASLRSAVQVGARADHLDTWRDLSPVMTVEADRLGQLIEDLLTLSKAQEGPRSMVADDVDLDEVLDRELKRLRSTGKVHVTSSIEPVRVTGSEAMLTRVVRNLADNASRAARSEVRLSLHLAAAGRAVIAVDDDGPGVREEDRGRIFERFVRLDAGRARHSGGSGLGLAIVKELVALHGGSVEVKESADLRGARFEVTIPRQLDAPKR